MTTLAPPCLPPTPKYPVLLFSSPFSVILTVTSPYQARHSLYHCKLQCTHSHHKFIPLQASTRLLRQILAHKSVRSLHWHRYSFSINFPGQSRQLEAIAIYNSLEAFRALQAHQVPYFKTLLYLDIMIGQIRTIVSYPWSTQLVYSSWLPCYPRYLWELLENFLITSPSFERPHWLIRVDCQIFLGYTKKSFTIQLI